MFATPQKLTGCHDGNGYKYKISWQPLSPHVVSSRVQTNGYKSAFFDIQIATGFTLNLHVANKIHTNVV
jgi:hypothetical protein